MNKLTIVLGDELFAFPSLAKWKQKAKGWFANCGVPVSDTVCIDTSGRVCACGRDFVRAHNEGTYPIKVYQIVPEGTLENEDGNVTTCEYADCTNELDDRYQPEEGMKLCREHADEFEELFFEEILPLLCVSTSMLDQIDYECGNCRPNDMDGGK